MKIAVIGVGLIGGSMALKLRAQGVATYIFGIDRSDENLQKAKELGIIDQTAVFDLAIKQAEVIIVAVPVDATIKILPEVLDLIGSHQTVIDVGSTKSSIAKAVKNHPNRNRYVAFHPMWGTENSGPEAAKVDSFSQRAAVICDAKDSASDALDIANRIADALGMHIIRMNSKDHDVHTAYISHISHITSYALANTVLAKEQQEETIFQLASSGFSSTVRLAKSHSEMWLPIFMENRENVLDVLNEHILQLQNFKTALENADASQLEGLIKNANKIRAILEQKS